MADELAFSTQDTPTSTIYHLQLSDEHGKQTIWSREVALINGKKPLDYCILTFWGKNEHGLLAIVYSNEFFGRILQFDPANQKIAEINIGSKWIKHKKRSEEVKLVPPDRILASSNGVISETIIRGGILYNPDGEVFAENPVITKHVAPAPSRVSEAAATPPRKVSSNAPASPPDLGPNAAMGNLAVWAALNKVQVPQKWLEKQNDHVRNAVSKKQFLTSKGGVLGVIDASGRFVMWPGAPRNSGSF